MGEAGIEPSVGNLGDSYDNALAEAINGLFKAEVIHCRDPWRSFEAVEYATLVWVDRFNSRRLLEPIGNIPQAEAEANFYAALETEDMAAYLTKISLRKNPHQFSAHLNAAQTARCSVGTTAPSSAADSGLSRMSIAGHRSCNIEVTGNLGFR